MTEPGPGSTQPPDRLLLTAELRNRDRYQLLTSIVVPRPIAWISSRSAGGIPNLAPFSYFAALSATPFLVGISIGSRRGVVKDTLRNIQETNDFCINVVTERQLAAMNESSGEHPPEVDEFGIAGVAMAEAEAVTAPYVADCPAVLECTLHQQVDLGGGGNVFVIAEVVAVRLTAALPHLPDTLLIDPEVLRPVGRLGGEGYTLVRDIHSLARPAIR
jgi:flavin reductase (DIM6/NTAB) family NADH-FMN oxidoreductase RutF